MRMACAWDGVQSYRSMASIKIVCSSMVRNESSTAEEKAILPSSTRESSSGCKYGQADIAENLVFAVAAIKPDFFYREQLLPNLGRSYTLMI